MPCTGVAVVTAFVSLHLHTRHPVMAIVVWIEISRVVF